MKKENTTLDGAIGLLSLLARLALFFLLCWGVMFLILPIYHQGLLGMIAVLVAGMGLCRLIGDICFGDL